MAFQSVAWCLPPSAACRLLVHTRLSGTSQPVTWLLIIRALTSNRVVSAFRVLWAELLGAPPVLCVFTSPGCARMGSVAEFHGQPGGSLRVACRAQCPTSSPSPSGPVSDSSLPAGGSHLGRFPDAELADHWPLFFGDTAQVLPGFRGCLCCYPVVRVLHGIRATASAWVGRPFLPAWASVSVGCL